MKKEVIPMKKYLAMLLIVCMLLSLSACGQQGDQAKAKNVILMISDGTSVGIPTLARWFKSYDKQTGGFDTDTRLNVDPLASGLIRTYWEDADGIPGAMTDSAPGGTAFSTGYKTYDKYVGVGPDGTPHATVLELAESLGKSTGLVVTVNAQHATPADFAAHTTNRKDFEAIAAQMLESNVDVVFGGGSQYLQNRVDGRDLVAELQEKGYEYLTAGKELESYQGEQVYGLFAPNFMAFDIDREYLAPEQPSLVEMTDKAIELLSANKKGFFLMVEGSKVDTGAHKNDPAAVVSEYLAFDKAVAAALSFAEKRDDTMVIIVEDHGTGGISIGSEISNKTYASYPLKDIIEPLTNAKITSSGVMELLMQGRNAEEVLEMYGVKDPSPEELQWAQDFTPDESVIIAEGNAKLGAMLSKRCNIGWTTLGHTGEDVVLYSYLPGDKRMTGLYENTEIAKAICNAWGATLTEDVCLHQTK